MWWGGDQSCRRRLDDLEDRFATVERTVKGLELEWIETLDKVKRLMGRVAKRAKVEEAEGTTPNGAPQGPTGYAARLLEARRHHVLPG